MTKWPEAKAVKRADAVTVAEFLYNEIVCRHGCPQKISSDRGIHFRNDVIKELMSKLGTNHHFSTPYHPQTNGLVERFNRSLCESIAKLVEKIKDWDLLIPSILFAYRTAKNPATKMTPFYLVYGREAQLPIHPSSTGELLEGTILHRTYDLIGHLPKLRESAVENVQVAQDQQKTYHDTRQRIASTFDIGDKVLMYRAALEHSRSHKLDPKWQGPFFIHDRLPHDVYRLRTLDGKVLASPINIKMLKKYND